LLAEGLRDVVAGRREELAFEHPCTAGGEPRWYAIRLTRAAGEAGAGAVVTLADVTERRRAEEALAESRRRLAAVAALGQRALAEADTEALASEAIDAVAERLGAEARDLRQMLSAGDSRFLRVTLAPGAAGAYTREDIQFVQAAMNVVTAALEREQLEKVIEDIGEALQHAVESVARFGPDGRHANANAAYADTFGYESGEMSGLPWERIVHPEDVPSADEARRRMLESGRGEVEARGVRKDGSLFFASFVLTRLLDRNGGDAGCLCFVKDISERKSAEVALRRSEEKYRDLLDNANDIILSVAADGSFIYVNRAWRDVLGYDGDLCDLTFWDVVDPSSAEACEDAFRRALAGEPVPRLESTWRTKDGREVAVEGSINASLRPDATPATRGVFRDVTERKRLEQQLLQSQRMDAVGRLAGGVAHDFNNLLTVINGYCDFALQQIAASDPLRHDIEEIHRAGERAAELTRQLLAFSRRQVLQPKVVDLNAAVAGMGKMLERLIGEHIELATAPGPSLGRIMADPGQLEQVIVNLAVNARDAMPGGGKLLLETRNVELGEAYSEAHPYVEPKPYVMLSVSDTGPGMDAATRAQIFEPFFTTKEHGTGLGLATVYGIVKQSGGSIEVYSEPGRGTTFKLYFPRTDGDAPAREQRAGAWAPGGSETVLVAEDEPRLRNLAVEILRRCGYEVLEAADGDEALRVCEGHKGPIHLVVTDVVMPKRSGRELAEQLALARPRTKVLYMSGYTDDAIVRHGVLEEGVPFIGKPFSPDALARKVRDVLDGGDFGF
jgi:PAS domain S-box-containing protein